MIISRGLNTPVNIISSFRSSIGPSTRKAIFDETLISVKLAATNASASLHSVISTATNIIPGMARIGWSRRKRLDPLVADLLPGECGQNRAQDQEHRDIDEIVQGGSGDITEPRPGMFSSSSAGVHRANHRAGPTSFSLFLRHSRGGRDFIRQGMAGIAKVVSSEFPYFLY